MSDDTRAGHRERLRKRYIKGGLTGFHDYEAVELLLTYAIPRRDVKPLAKRLLKEFGGLQGLFEASPEELEKVKGMGEAASLLPVLVRAVSGAYLSDKAGRKVTIRCAEDVVGSLDDFGDLPPEGLLAVYLNSKNVVLGVEVVCRGEDLSPRKVVEEAFRHNARSVIFVRKTPGGGAAIEQVEKGLVKALEEAASAIDMLVHDYIVVAAEGHVSAREYGLLKKR